MNPTGNILATKLLEQFPDFDRKPLFVRSSIQAWSLRRPNERLVAEIALYVNRAGSDRFQVTFGAYDANDTLWVLSTRRFRAIPRVIDHLSYWFNDPDLRMRGQEIYSSTLTEDELTVV